MRRGNLFWGALLILVGVLFLLQTLGILSFNIWGVIWPLVIILIGVNLLSGVFFKRRAIAGEQLTIPLDGASSADILFNHGAGVLQVHGGGDSTLLLSGTFAGGVDKDLRQSGTIAHLSLQPSSNFYTWDIPFGFTGRRGMEWDVSLNRDVPLSLEFKTGASDNTIDLTGLKVTDVRLDTGASSTRLTLPEAAGFTRGRIQSGAASVGVRIPAQVAAHIEVKSGLAGITVDTQRFPKSGNVYESPDYISAPNRIDLFIETGVGAVDIR